MTTQVDAVGLRAKARLGIRVAVWLAVLTVVEYFVAVGLDSPLVWLLFLAAAKGWLIMRYFMHVNEVFEGGH